MKPKSISFAYVQPLSFSGQSAASEMLITGLAARGWECRRIPIYPLDRAIVNPVLRYVRFVLYMMQTWFGLLRLSFGGASILHLNLGQSLASFLRVALQEGSPYNVGAVSRYTKAAGYRKFSETLIADLNE